MKIIAHAVKNLQDAQNADMSGCNLLEIDVSQNIITSNFVIQHNGIKGKFGIGKNLNNILNSRYNSKLILDLKHAKYSLNYQRKICKLLKKEKVKNLRITGIDLKIISQIGRVNNAKVYYGFLNKKSLQTFQKLTSKLYEPYRFSIKSKMIDEKLVQKLKSQNPNTEIWAWTVNDMAETKRLMKMEIDGIITDNWETLLRYK